MNADPTAATARHLNAYTLLLLFIAGMGGLLYGYDIGIIGAALLYLGKTVDLSLRQESWIVAAVLGGGMFSSLVAGGLADWTGRKKVMIAAGLLFVASVGLIVTARGFLPLFLGRALQGLSAGMIAVVIPLYLAESLPAAIRGRGTAAFQLLLTIGIFTALTVGTHYTARVEASLATAPAGAARAIEDAAWRAMFRSALYPGLVFLAGSFAVTESPRWLFRRGREAEALAALEKSRGPAGAQLEWSEMQESRRAEPARGQPGAAHAGSLLQRKYVLPFVLACAVLGLNQATGINSVLQFLVVILQQAGLPAAAAAHQASLVTLVNVAFTVAGLLLVDRLGRTALLKIGTSGIVAAFVCGAAIFHHYEAARADVTAALRARLAGSALAIRVDASALGHPEFAGPTELTVLYAAGGEERLATGASAGPDSVIHLAGPDLRIKRAKFGRVPPPAAGTAVTACLMVFIAAFAIGPGVCVWLALSELMPTRIRSWGMGIGLLINQGISTGIAAVFLPFVGNYGYAAVFLFWAACTLVYFAVAAWALPETKGRTLEEIEAYFARR